ncbi:MAG: alpha-(1-_3)-arabinofuranosyltransferase family protein, partial [Candidatus Nanopelagicales bacterium]
MTRAIWRFRLAACCLVLVALAFVQSPGQVAADTKLDLTVDPAAFVGRSLHLWNQHGFFGELQNQAYGYLWPQGSFFLAGHLAAIPPWVVQRLWWSLILIVAFLGIVRLSRLLGLTNPLARVVAGLAYALSPRVMSTIGPISSETWEMALAPWILVPLILGSLGGSERRWVGMSGIAAACAGGINAVATTASLPAGVWFLITRSPSPRRRRLAAWWALAILLASTWWLLPLVLLGKYSPPFLDWIESGST